MPQGEALQYQEDSHLHPVAFASHSFSKAEKNYHSSKLEFLAPKWAVTEQFKDCHAFKPFEVCTNNNLLTYINTTPNLDVIGHRWVGALASFIFSLHYQKGADNGSTNALSQVLTPAVALASKMVHSLLEGAEIGASQRCEVLQPLMEAELLRMEEELEARMLAGQTGAKLHIMDWESEQKENPLLRAMNQWLKDGKLRSLNTYFSKDLGAMTATQVYIRIKEKLCIEGRHHIPVEDTGGGD